MPDFPTLDDLKPLIEVVHHACRAGAYDEALSIYTERIDQRDAMGVDSQLGACETDLALMQEFFPNSDTSQEPQVSKASDKSWILNEVGLCLMSLGRLSEAVPFYERANAMSCLTQKNGDNASVGYQNLAELHAFWASWRPAPRPPSKRWGWLGGRRTSRMNAIRWPSRRGRAFARRE